jgi:hypothetical protein
MRLWLQTEMNQADIAGGPRSDSEKSSTSENPTLAAQYAIGSVMVLGAVEEKLRIALEDDSRRHRMQWHESLRGLWISFAPQS